MEHRNISNITPIDTMNKFLVGVIGDDVMLMKPPIGRITKQDALLLAAWLVAMADMTNTEFPKYLKAVQSI
jgi:hypothetical protein